MNTPLGHIAAHAAELAVVVRDGTWDDRAAISDVLLTSQVFGQVDADCVDEMYVETWQKPRADGYRWLMACDAAGSALGFACYGVESLTQDTWDLFWICVRPEARGKGAGHVVDYAIGQTRNAA